MKKAMVLWLYCLLLTTWLFATKMVLSVLGFRYPMVFQGWQTMVGFAVFQLLACCPDRNQPCLSVSSLDRSGFLSLMPTFVLYTLSIISASVALASLPIAVFVAAANLTHCLVWLVDIISSFRPAPGAINAGPAMSEHQTNGKSVLQSVCCLVVVSSSVTLLVWAPVDARDLDPATMLNPFLSLAVHIACGFCMVMHGRIADARFSMTDKQLYSYAFALIVLAPASLYLDEAFKALHFRHKNQVNFIVGSVVSAVCGSSVTLLQSRLRDHHLFGLVHHGSLGAAAILSMMYFGTDLPIGLHGLVVLNLSANLMLPSHMKPDTEYRISPPPATTTTTGTSESRRSSLI